MNRQLIAPPSAARSNSETSRPRVVLSRKSLILKITSTALSAPSVAYQAMPMLSHDVLFRSQDTRRSGGGVDGFRRQVVGWGGGGGVGG